MKEVEKVKGGVKIGGEFFSQKFPKKRETSKIHFDGELPLSRHLVTTDGGKDMALGSIMTNDQQQTLIVEKQERE